MILLSTSYPFIIIVNTFHVYKSRARNNKLEKNSKPIASKLNKNTLPNPTYGLERGNYIFQMAKLYSQME